MTRTLTHRHSAHPSSTAPSRLASSIPIALIGSGFHQGGNGESENDEHQQWNTDKVFSKLE